MGWGSCGEDSKGRPIGYNHGGRCDAPGCKKRIHRGLAYACGQMHGEDEISCEGYFCDAHVSIEAFKDASRRAVRLCATCAAHAREHGLLVDD